MFWNLNTLYRHQLDSKPSLKRLLIFTAFLDFFKHTHTMRAQADLLKVRTLCRAVKSGSGT
jgi:hypothetical protein